MPVGNSGRVVIEIDPELKKELYQLLRLDGSNLKEWFLQRVDEYMDDREVQQKLFDGDGGPRRGANQ